MSEKINMNDPFVRRTLWKAYKKKCFYCKKPIQYNDFEVDHVIPKSLGNDEAIKLYDLPKDFELNSYSNLVPACSVCNRRKRNIKYDKKHIILFYNEIKGKISKIEELEKKYIERNKESEVSATLSTALEELGIENILTIVKEQPLTTYKRRIIQETIEKISKIDLEEVMNLINQKELSEYGIALSILSVIEPIDYNMADGIFFYNNFGFVFWSTSEMLRDKVEQQIRKIANEISTSLIFSANLDEITDRLKELSNEKRQDYGFLFEIIYHFTNIMVSTQKNVILKTFVISYDIEEFYCIYLGTLDLDLDEIKRKHYKKSRFWMQNKDLNLKKSYLIIASEV